MEKAGLENAGSKFTTEYAGPENVGPENAGLENEGPIRINGPLKNLKYIIDCWRDVTLEHTTYKHC